MSTMMEAADVVVSNYEAGGATVLLNNSGSKTGPNFTITAAENSQTDRNCRIIGNLRSNDDW